MASICKLITFDEKRDKDILAYLDSLAKSGKASQFVRDAIRLAMDEERVSLATILEEIREIKRNGIVAISENGETGQGEPEDIAKALEGLGL